MSALWPYMVKGLGRGTYGLGLEGPGLGLGLDYITAISAQSHRPRKCAGPAKTHNTVN